jgi:hypothetical protein
MGRLSVLRWQLVVEEILMYTSLVLAVVMGPGVAPPTSIPETPTWQSDYVAARKRGSKDNKALAVFIGSGARGWEKVCRESKLTPAVRKLLADHYVCVYVDAGEARGKRLADDFDMTQGLVVSTRDGESQAFRQTGRIGSKDLESTLRLFSNGYRNYRTETLQDLQQVSFREPARQAPVRQVEAVPVMRSFGSFGGFSGRSC